MDTVGKGRRWYERHLSIDTPQKSHKLPRGRRVNGPLQMGSNDFDPDNEVNVRPRCDDSYEDERGFWDGECE